MKLCVLGSGSGGNAIYVSRDGFGLLVDAGLSLRETAARLAAVGESVERVRAVLVTHEHSDHVKGIAPLCNKHQVTVHLNRGTAVALDRLKLPPSSIRHFKTGEPFHLGPFRVDPFPLLDRHDASDPVGFILAAGGVRVGIATDFGSMPEDRVKRLLRGCRALVLESNHDTAMLRCSARPAAVKARIEGRTGHLSNEQSAALLAEIATGETTDVFLAHLSEECNCPEHARNRAWSALSRGGHTHISLRSTYADRASEVVEYAGEETQPSFSDLPDALGDGILSAQT